MKSADRAQDLALRDVTGDRREQLMIQAAKLYYDLDRTQAEVGRELGLNRFQVARLLREARDTGVVRIEILPRGERRPATEATLQRAFGLKEAIIVRAGDRDDESAALDAVVSSAAGYLAGLIPSPRLIGVSWGRTMSAVAARLPKRWANGVEVVLLNGATHLKSALVPTNDVAERFAAAGDGTARLLPVPAILGRAKTRQALEADPTIAAVLRRGAEAPIACFGLGGLLANSVLVESGYLDAAAVLSLRGKGAVGDILGRIIDAEGDIVDRDLDRRTIGLAPALLRQKALSIGISTGHAKHAVVLAALRARYINVLITDEATASHALEHQYVR